MSTGELIQTGVAFYIIIGYFASALLFRYGYGFGETPLGMPRFDKFSDETQGILALVAGVLWPLYLIWVIVWVLIEVWKNIAEI